MSDVHQNKKRVLIADDDTATVSILSQVLKAKGYDIKTVPNGELAKKALETEQFDLLLSDIKMEPVDGMQLLRETRQMRPQIGAIMLTAYATVATAVEAMKEGAFDYIPKPFRIDELAETVKRALEYQRSIAQQISGSSRVETNKYFGNIVAESDQMVRVCEMIKRIAPTKTTVLITGERGTGKKLVAEAIHRFSARSEGPFISINCAALPETLIETELFGHAKESLSGANVSSEGLFEDAEGGTLFLDEVNAIPLGLQSKFLRALYEKKIQKAGGFEERNIDVRIIVATSQNLKFMAKEGAFREDLYARLSAISIDIPPLRKRPEDILPLLQHFITQEMDDNKIPAVDNTVLAILRNYSWPGNVRELQNVIQHCLSFLEEDQITKDILPSKLILSYEQNPSLKATLTGSFEKGKFLKAFLRSKEKEYLKTVVNSIDDDDANETTELDEDLAKLYKKEPDKPEEN